MTLTLPAWGRARRGGGWPIPLDGNTLNGLNWLRCEGPVALRQGPTSMACGYQLAHQQPADHMGQQGRWRGATVLWPVPREPIAIM